ncbi:MAG TPA: hypothetical protein VF796_05360, partial [Humisphaera sp.]
MRRALLPPARHGKLALLFEACVSPPGQGGRVIDLLSSPDVWFVVGSAFVVAGLVAWTLGRFPRRRGRTPHCRRCGYVLTGLTSDRCPECGRDVGTSKAVVRGERHVRPRVAWAGLLSVVVGLLPIGLIGYGRFRGIDWYHHHRVEWVIDD